MEAVNTLTDKKIIARRKKRQIKRNLVAYSFVAPNFIGFCIFTLVPVLFAFWLGFCEWDGNNPIEFVGLSNYLHLAEDAFFIKSLTNTVIYTLGYVPLTLAVSLALAIALNQKVKAMGVFRTLSFFPYVASTVAVASVWCMLFHPAKGPVNSILYYIFHVSRDNLPQWFNGHLVLLSYILFSVWKSMGYYMVIYLAGLQGISGELYESASLDGANAWHKFRYITWPQLKPTTFFIMVMLTINSFKIYDTAVLLAGRGETALSQSAIVLVYYIYQNAFSYWKLGYSSAIAMVLFAIVLVVTLVQFKGESKFDND